MTNVRCRRSLYLFLVPLTVYLVFFALYPLFYEIYISFYDYNLGSPKTFSGLKNYIMMVNDKQFLGSLVTTAVFVLGAVGLEFLLGLGGAFLLNKESRVMDVIRTVILIPTVFTPLVAGLVWKALYQPDLGVISYYLRSLGLPIGRGLTVERSTALLSVVLVDVWEWTPLVLIIILAGLKNLPKEPYEAGLIDGASSWQLFRYISLPLLRPAIIVALLVRSLDALKVFDIIWAITGGGPGTATTVANLRIFEVGLQQLRVGYASALSNVLLIVSLLVGVVFVRAIYSKRYRWES